ncbi:PilT/PilU family type 4a pilus ATPase [Sulfurovum sp. zt1-1]|uniref:PilT/PilU family type 4a pilus ATPase n=1 Tax=Sulfurovum zhangzhouensis TaxID=3019067 RepID=A0ABT7QVA6_9BACT|nr:PilT/PilU family type 4a pilus ATPase [Sulfurovum zhangzhouensis]MDM5270661.1 PilT/PilU family type 4a pilus ATPase [Sulfurovum zhangzhouensis]
MKTNLNKFLDFLIDNHGSDLHLKSGSTVHYRKDGELLSLDTKICTVEDIENVAKSLLSEESFKRLQETKELDLNYTYNEQNHFRVNFFYHIDGMSIIFRLVPMEILSFEKLRLPEVIKELADTPRGLILVTGVTGSGKSTTIATMIDRINSTQKKHIVTIEDPIEFIHHDKKSVISQRGVGENTLSYKNAFKSVLREDPDVIFVGEIRDLESLETALHAASTGHLVFSTLHTLDAKETINRLINMFPTHDQNRIRMTLSSVLEGIISQRLVKREGGGRVVAVEVMKNTTRIATLIAEGRDKEILDAIEEGSQVYGSQSFDQALLELFQQGLISEATALENATIMSDMKLKLQGIEIAKV